jgi:hypothetical protein
MSGADTVAFSNHEGFVQLVKLLRSLGVIELVGKNVVEIKQPEILDGLGFATFIATVAAARWRRELFVFVPYGDKTLLALAETTARARFPVTSSRHATARLYPGMGIDSPKAAACATRSYFAFNWSTVRTDAFPIPDEGCKGGEACQSGCPTPAWITAAKLDGDQAAACLGGHGIVLPVPFALLEALYTDLPQVTMEEAEAGAEIADDKAPTRDVRTLYMAPFDAYVTVKVASALKAEYYAPNTYLTKPFDSAELDAVAYRTAPPFLAVVETTLSNEEGLPLDTERSTKPLDRLKIKYLQWLSMSMVKDTTLRYIYACAGTFAFPTQREWASLFKYVTEQHADKVKVISLGEKYSVTEVLQAGVWEPAKLREAFDWFVGEIVKQATS